MAEETKDTETAAGHAAVALDAYIAAQGGNNPNMDDEAYIIDLIADLLHLAEQRIEGDFDVVIPRILRCAENHHDSERIDQILADGEADGSTKTGE